MIEISGQRIILHFILTLPITVSHKEYEFDMLMTDKFIKQVIFISKPTTYSARD